MSSIFAYIFGSPKPKARPPTPPAGPPPVAIDALSRLRSQENQLEKRVNMLEAQIRQLLQQAEGEARAGNRPKGLQLLKKKQLIDEQLRSTQGMLDNIVQQRLTLELAQVQVQTVKAIEATNHALKESGVDVDKAQDALDEMAEHVEASKDIGRMIAAPLPGSEGIADAAEAELEAMMAAAAPAAAPAAAQPTLRRPTPVPESTMEQELAKLAAEDPVVAPPANQGRVAVPA